MTSRSSGPREDLRVARRVGGPGGTFGQEQLLKLTFIYRLTSGWLLVQ
jgi:hypothetical protein